MLWSEDQSLLQKENAFSKEILFSDSNLVFINIGRDMVMERNREIKEKRKAMEYEIWGKDDY